MRRLQTSLWLAVGAAGFAASLELLLFAAPKSGWTVGDALTAFVAEWTLLVGITSLCAVGLWGLRLHPSSAATARIALAGLALGTSVCLGGTAARLGLGAQPSAARSGPDILLFTLDTTRADALSIYGNQQVKTPNIDRLAMNGVVFEQALATAGQTGPSHLSILSGKYPFETGVYSNATPVHHVPSVVPRLREAGWSTSAFVSGYPLHPRFGFDQGFDVYDALFDGALGEVSRRLFRLSRGASGRERRGDLTIDRAIRNLQNAEGAVFSWIHLYDPHGPYPRQHRLGEQSDPKVRGDWCVLQSYPPTGLKSRCVIDKKAKFRPVISKRSRGWTLRLVDI